MFSVFRLFGTFLPQWTKQLSFSARFWKHCFLRSFRVWNRPMGVVVGCCPWGSHPRETFCLTVCLHMHAQTCMVLTVHTSTPTANPNGNSSPSWCNWTVIDCNTKGYMSCSQAYTCKALSKDGKTGKSLNHMAETLLLLPLRYWGCVTQR